MNYNALTCTTTSRPWQQCVYHASQPHHDVTPHLRARGASEGHRLHVTTKYHNPLLYQYLDSWCIEPFCRTIWSARSGAIATRSPGRHQEKAKQLTGEYHSGPKTKKKAFQFGHWIICLLAVSTEHLFCVAYWLVLHSRYTCSSP